MGQIAVFKLDPIGFATFVLVNKKNKYRIADRELVAVYQRLFFDRVAIDLSTVAAIHVANRNGRVLA